MECAFILKRMGCASCYNIRERPTVVENREGGSTITKATFHCDFLRINLKIYGLVPEERWFKIRTLSKLCMSRGR